LSDLLDLKENKKRWRFFWPGLGWQFGSDSLESSSIS
jgi:hypothetical protein